MARMLVPDELWEIVEPLLPRHKARAGKRGRPPVDDRAALTGIIFVLHSGIPWWMLPREMGCTSGGAKRSAVGPLALQGAVESFDLAVLPWAVRPDQDVLHSRAVEQILHRVAVGVVPGVVGHDRIDVDAVFGEASERSFEEHRGGWSLLVVEDLRIGEAAVVVDNGVDVVVSDAGVATFVG